MVLAQKLDSSHLNFIRFRLAKGFFITVPLALGWQVISAGCKISANSASFLFTPKLLGIIHLHLPSSISEKEVSFLSFRPHPPLMSWIHFLLFDSTDWPMHALCGFLSRIMDPLQSSLLSILSGLKQPLCPDFSTEKWIILWVIAACTLDTPFPALCLRWFRGLFCGKGKKGSWEIHSLTDCFFKFWCFPTPTPNLPSCTEVSESF